jgi:flagellar biosynthesis protein FlhF
MKVKRFVAADMRRALELVRQELGPDAIILSNKRIPEGIELLTTMGSDVELQQLQERSLEQRTGFSPSEPLLSDGVLTREVERRTLPTANTHSPMASSNAGKSGAQIVRDIEQAQQRMLNARKAEESAKEMLLRKNQSLKNERPIKTAAEKYPLFDTDTTQKFKNDQDSKLTELQMEIADMRILLEKKLDKLTGQNIIPKNSSVLTTVLRRLERLNLPKEVIIQAVKSCQKTKNIADAWSQVLNQLAQTIPIIGHDLVDRGGVFAFVGPTGVGKTTTIGKLAARYVMAHGADKVALVTTDTYRIAAHDQLRSFARILRVPMHVVDEANPLDKVLAGLRKRSLVLIDTAGFRHGDPHLKEQLEKLAQQKSVNTCLVLSCNSQAQMLKASIHAYGHAYNSAGLKACVLTKLDETASLGEALGVVMQHRLPIAYITDGQDIPKHLQVARANQLISKAVSLLRTHLASAVS